MNADKAFVDTNILLYKYSSADPHRQTRARDHIRAAMENEEQYRISFWGALILAAAESGRAEVLFTEDLNDGRQYGSVLVRNPITQ